MNDIMNTETKEEEKLFDDLQENKVEKAEPEEKEENEKKPVRPASIIKELLIYAILIVVCIWVVPEYVIQRTVVSGDSMVDTLQNGDSLLVDKVSYRFSDPERYDIIVFYPKGRDVEEYYVKRIYGLPGETIQIKNNEIYVNGEKIPDEYGYDEMLSYGMAEEPVTLGPDEYFVLGDHRSISLDSRFPYKDEQDGPGPVKRENIAGKAVLRIWPINSFGRLDS